MESFELCYERYADLGAGMFLRSPSGAALVASRAPVGETGIEDIDFGSAFTAELVWRIGSAAAAFAAFAVALHDDAVTAHAGPSARLAGGFAIFSLTGRSELDALAKGPIADRVIYLPAYPDLTVAATTSREEVEWSLYDPAAKYAHVIAEVAHGFGLPLVEVEKSGVERESLEAVRTYIPQIAAALSG